jgi:hypothetical protein
VTSPGPRMPAAGDTGWDRLARAVAEVLPPQEVDGVWAFTPVRREHREWGTAVLSRLHGDRRRIYTARYVLDVKGKTRGKFESFVQEVGSGPMEALAKVLLEAQRRVDDEHPPVAVPPEIWFSSVGTRVDGPSR